MTHANINESTGPLARPAPKRRVWLILLLMVIVFVSGVVSGGGAALFVVRREVIALVQHPEAAAPKVADRIASKMGLDPSQRDRVEQIVRAHQVKLMAIRKDVQPRVEAELAQVEEEVAGAMDPKQQAAWRALCKELRQIWTPPMPGDTAASGGGTDRR